MHEPFLVNPRHRRGGGFLGPYRGTKRNPFGEEVMIVGANPFHGFRRRHRRHRRGGFMHNPVAALSQVTHLGGVDWRKAAVPALVAASSMAASRIVPTMIAARGLVVPDAKWKLWALQFGTGAAGAAILFALKQGQYATAWGIGALASIFSDVLSTYVLPQIGLSGLSSALVYRSNPAVNMGAYPQEVGAYPNEVSGLASSPYDNTATAYPY